MWLLELLIGKRKDASASAMIHEAENLEVHGVFPGTDEELEKFDHFEGKTTLVYKEDGTTSLFNHKFVDTNVAAGLLDVDADPFFIGSPVEMKYYGDAAPDVKIYLLCNRVMRKENPGLWNHLKIREKGPVVLHRMTNKPRVIRPPPIKVYKPMAIKIPTHQPCSVWSPIPGTF